MVPNPNDTANEESLALEQVAWYNNDFAMNMGKILTEETRKKEIQLMNLEDIYLILVPQITTVAP